MAEDTCLRILHLEDEPNDAELAEETLTSAGFVCSILRVETREEFEAALTQGGFDLILSDKSLPHYDGLNALALAREQRPEVPFIFVSATLGEEVAIERLKNGATDYALKQQLSRLVPFIQRALREVAEQQDRKRARDELIRSEARYRQIIETS